MQYNPIPEKYLRQWAVRDNREPHYYPHCCLPAWATDHISGVEGGRRARLVRVTDTVVGIIFLHEPHAGVLYGLFLHQLREKQAFRKKFTFM